MIQKMRKYSFLIYHREYEDFLRAVQELGVVHISERVNPRDADDLCALQSERTDLVVLSKRLLDLQNEGKVELISPPTSKQVLEQHIASARQALEKLEELRTEHRKYTELSTSLSVWGEYDLQLIERLAAAGYTLSYYITNGTTFTEAYAEQHDAIAVARVGMTQYFVRLETTGMPGCIDAERLPPPIMTQSQALAQCDVINRQLSELLLEIRTALPQWLSSIAQYDRSLANRYAFGAARLQAMPQASDTLMFLEGWVPETRAIEMEVALADTGYFYKQSEIEEVDAVPILLKNNAFARLFEPITQMFSLPNYNEVDQTVLFAPFFMIFFGLCMGDAGYGAIIFVLATIARMRLDRESGSAAIAALVQWLGGAACLVGLATGSIFGVGLSYSTNPEYPLNQDNLMALSVVIGLIQIFFAKIVAAYKIKLQRGTRYALAPFAWIIFLLGIGIYIGMPYVQVDWPQWFNYIIYATVGISGLVVFFYNTPGKNPLLNLGVGVWNAYNVASGLLGDTLSYIRLFAIGLTGAVLGGVFNSLAIEQTASLPIYVRVPIMLLILVAGHGLNIALAMISSFVHPLRLTFVEYYKNSEFEGGGRPYTPLEK